MAAVQAIAWLLSRVALIATFFDIAYWLNFLANDPYGFGGATLDARVVKPAETCTAFDKSAFIQDVILTGLFWAQHSFMSRKSVKEALGLWQSPLGRPVFATCSWLVWLLQIHFWRPITDCARFDPPPTHKWVLHACISLLGVVFVVLVFCYMPQHVFGTEHHRAKDQQEKKGGQEQEKEKRSPRRLPLGLGRHPAALGFLWVYLTWPAYTPSHILLLALTAFFIFVPIIFFPEGGLYGSDEYRAVLPSRDEKKE